MALWACSLVATQFMLTSEVIKTMTIDAPIEHCAGRRSAHSTHAFHVQAQSKVHRVNITSHQCAKAPHTSLGSDPIVMSGCATATRTLIDRLASNIALEALGEPADPVVISQLRASLRDEAFSVLLGLHPVRGCASKGSAAIFRLFEEPLPLSRPCHNCLPPPPCRMLLYLTLPPTGVRLM